MQPNRYFQAVRLLLTLLVLLLLGHACHAQPAAQRQRADCTLGWLRDHLWVREATGHNDGPAVWALIHAGGGQRHDEWCGYTQLAAQRACGLPVPAEAGAARAWFRARRRLVYTQGGIGSLAAVRPGYCVGIRYGSAIHHIIRAAVAGRAVRRGRPARGWYCYGGNEGRGPNAGIHYTFYPAASFNAVANWLY